MKAYLREKKNAKCYYCILKWEEDGRSFSKELSTGIPIKGNNKREAKIKIEEIRKEFESKVKAYDYVEVKDLTFDVYMKEWLENQKRHLKPSTLYGYDLVINHHIVPYFEKHRVLLTDLTARHLQTYYNKKLDSGLSACTVKKHHANIRKALQNALEQDMIPYNVADRTRLPRIEKYIPDIYDEKQLTNLLQKSKGHTLEPVIVICCHYALRRGEVCGIRWSDVDLESRVLHIRHSRVYAKTEIAQDSTKTDSSSDVLPIDDFMFDYFKELKNKQRQNQLFFGASYNYSGYVCVWDDGNPLKVSYVSHAFNDLLKKNNLPHIRLHDLRHSVATNLLNNGVDLKIIQEYLRHSTMSTTANFYLHPDIKQKQKAANMMSQLLMAK